MSSKKINHSKKKLSPLGVRLDIMLKKIDLKASGFCEKTGISKSYFSQIRLGKQGKKGGLNFWECIEKHYPTWIPYLRFSENEPPNKSYYQQKMGYAGHNYANDLESPNLPTSAEGPPIYNTSRTHPDPHVSDLLQKTEAILNSRTDYATSLAANINSFHRSLELEKRTTKLEKECEDLRKQVATLEAKIDLITPRRDTANRAA